MTMEVKQAAVVLPTGKAGAGKLPAARAQAEHSFGDALGLDRPKSKISVAQPKRLGDAEIDSKVETRHDWARFLARMGANDDRQASRNTLPDARETASTTVARHAAKPSKTPDEDDPDRDASLEKEAGLDQEDAASVDPVTCIAVSLAPHQSTDDEPRAGLNADTGEQSISADSEGSLAGKAAADVAPEGRGPASEATSTHRIVSATPTAPSSTQGQGDPSEPTPAKEAGNIASAEPQADDPKTSDAPRATTKVTVISEQSFVAPPAVSTTTHLAAKIAVALPSAAPADATSFRSLDATVAPAATHSLKIQLHPAELGMVTASLRFAGEQLSIEIQVDNADAYHRLNSDSDAIVGALRNLGYDIDRVTVLQPALTANATARSDTAASASGQTHQGTDQAGSGAANSGGQGTRERQPGTGESDARQGNDRSASRHGDRAGGSLYI